MRRIIPFLCLAVLTMFGNQTAAAETGGARIESLGIPEGFGELASNHEILVDLYFGGRKIGEAMVLVRPGQVKFKDPAKVLSLIPNLKESAELTSALGGGLSSNVGLVCAEGSSNDCGMLSPEIVGVILDEDRFRLDVFVNPRFLAPISEHEQLYLPTPTAPLSLTSSVGLALSGSNESSSVYNLQNRTILGFHDARIRTDSSFASKYGFGVDTLVGELDRPGVRYSAGLFWAPGLDLTGQRRIAGIGVATQFDTRADRDSLTGTPLVLFLSLPARVDFLVDGRLVSSSAYEAGNNVLDTANLPDGSYVLLLQIHQANGTVREERRFFAKSTQIAPVGQPICFAYAGLLANTRHGQAISVSRQLFYQVGAARRLGSALAVDLSIAGNNNKPLVEAGAWLITRLARVRVAALVSTKGDRGALLQLASANVGAVNINFDLRRVWSHDGKPLIPFSNYVDTFDSVAADGRQIGQGGFVQASGSIGYRFGAAYFAMIGSLRKDDGLPSDYSVGPSLNWPVVNANGLQVALQADAQLTRTTKSAYVGMRIFFTSHNYSLSSSAGGRSLSGKDDRGASRLRVVGDAAIHMSSADENGTNISAAAGLSREIDSTTGRGEVFVYSRFGSAHGQILHDFEGSDRTQYGLSIQTGAVVNREVAMVGGRNLAESGLVISIDGSANSEFEVLINGQPRGRVRPGSRLPVFLEPYRTYSVRLRPVDAASVWYDSASRDFTLYPGNVEHVEWHVEHLVTIFGRAIWANGEPVADALVRSRRGIGQSNTSGYFQIDASGNDVLSFTTAQGQECSVTLETLDKKDYHSLGRVICR